MAFLDSDDIWTKDSLAVRLAVTAEQPTCDFLATDWCNWPYENHNFAQAVQTSQGCLRQAKLRVKSFKKSFDTNHSISVSRPVPEFLVRCPVHTITVMVRRDLLLSIDGFNASLRRGEDTHCWLRLAARADFGFSPKVTAIYRIRTGSASHQHTVSESEGGPKACRALLQLEEMQPYKEHIKAKMGWYYLQNSYFYRKLGLRRKAFTQALLALITDWRRPKVLHNFFAASLCR